jgi:cohesin loading factor subunit SCC2
MQHFATPPPDSPVKDLNGDAPSNVPALSPFASMLLKHTNVSYARTALCSPGLQPPLTKTAHGTKTIDRSQKPLTPPRQAAPPPQVRTISQPKVETPKGYANTQNAQPPPSSSALSSAPQSTPIRSGPTVVAKPISGRREEYVRYDTISTPVTVLPKKKEDKRSDGGAAALKPHEREIVDRKTEELRSLVEKLLEDKQDPDGPDNFESVSTDEGDVYVMIPKAMVSLSDKMSSLINLGRFAALPVELVMNVQSLLQPGITSTTKNASFERPDETSEWSQSVSAAELALKASKMVLDTMIEGRDDYRMRREEIIDMIIDLIKFIKDACIVPIVQARRSGPTEVLFSAATGQRRELQAVLRLCGSVFSRFAVLLGKHNLSERALNSLEYLTLELVMEPNSDSEKDSVFTVQKFEQFRQKAVDVLAEIFARHAEQQSSILNGILSNLEKLPDKKASARQFKSAREVPIMTISALFMRFVQVAAANKTMPVEKDISKGTEEEPSEEESDNELGAAMKNKKRSRSDKTQLAQSLFAKAMQIAATIVTSLIERASNVSKTGDKPFRNLLDLFIEDFCNVLGSPEWPAAEMLLQQILVRMQNILQADLTAKQSVVDKDMALSTMSRIGCGALDLKIRLKKLKREKLDVSLSGLSSQLDRLLDEALNDDAREGINDMDLLAFDGPYRMVVESLPDYMDSLSSQDDPRLQSVSGCHVTLWMNAVNRAFPASAEDTDTYPLAVKNIRKHLESITMDSRWLAREQ